MSTIKVLYMEMESPDGEGPGSLIADAIRDLMRPGSAGVAVTHYGDIDQTGGLPGLHDELAQLAAKAEASAPKEMVQADDPDAPLCETCGLRKTVRRQRNRSGEEYNYWSCKPCNGKKISAGLTRRDKPRAEAEGSRDGCGDLPLLKRIDGAEIFQTSFAIKQALKRSDVLEATEFAVVRDENKHTVSVILYPIPQAAWPRVLWKIYRLEDGDVEASRHEGVGHWHALHVATGDTVMIDDIYHAATKFRGHGWKESEG